MLIQLKYSWKIPHLFSTQITVNIQLPLTATAAKVASVVSPCSNSTICCSLVHWRFSGLYVVFAYIVAFFLFLCHSTYICIFQVILAYNHKYATRNILVCISQFLCTFYVLLGCQRHISLVTRLENRLFLTKTLLRKSILMLNTCTYMFVVKYNIIYDICMQ